MLFLKSLLNSLKINETLIIKVQNNFVVYELEITRNVNDKYFINAKSLNYYGKDFEDTLHLSNIIEYFNSCKILNYEFI